jgi:hypothetical protein
MTISVTPLTPDHWPAFEDLFGKQGACYGCWCTHFRLPPAVRRDNDHQRNKDFIRNRIETGPPPGLLAFEGDRAVGWMQIGPRADVPEWNNSGRASAPLDDGPADDEAVWAISCFFLRTKARGRGLTHLLVAAGIDPARVSTRAYGLTSPTADDRTAEGRAINRRVTAEIGDARHLDVADLGHRGGVVYLSVQYVRHVPLQMQLPSQAKHESPCPCTYSQQCCDLCAVLCKFPQAAHLPRWQLVFRSWLR